MSKTSIVIFYVLIILIFSNIILAEEDYCKNVTFVNQNNQKLINYIVSVEYLDENIISQNYLDFDGKTTFCLNSKNNKYIFRIKDLLTNELYYSEATFLEENSNLRAIPVANIQGIIMDSQDNLLPEVELEFQCKSLSDFPLKTNNFGMFELNDVSLGNCLILAKYKENSGYLDVNLINNSDYHIKIIISEKNETDFGKLIFWISLIIIFSILVVAGFFWQNKNKINKSKIEKTIKITENMAHIMKTLNDTEIKIVTFLIESKGCASQTEIRKNTYIPKTSLHRYIKSLEQKNIINSFVLGKIKKIELTNFFLEK